MKYYIDYERIGIYTDVSFSETFKKGKIFITIKPNNSEGYSISEHPISFANGILKANEIEKLLFSSETEIDFDGLTHKGKKIEKVRYSRIILSGKEKVALKFIDYSCNYIFIPVYETLYMPVYAPIFDIEFDEYGRPFQQVILGSEIIDYDPLRQYIVDMPLEIVLNNNDIIILTLEEFDKRKSVNSNSQTNVRSVEVSLSDEIELYDKFKEAYNNLVLTKNNYFITGKAGTSKSTLLKYFIKNSEKSVVVLAPTGLSAIAIGGQTIHSFFKIPPHTIDLNNFRPPIKEIYRKTDTFLIDEISMVRSDLLDIIDLILKANQKNDLPFGGKQMVFFGDPFQLSPIVEKDQNVRQYFSDSYISEWFFHSKAYMMSDIQLVTLDRIYRQTDLEFINILNRVRIGKQTEEDISKLNSRCKINIPLDVDEIITLTSTNALAEDTNNIRLSKLSGKEFCFQGSFSGTFNKVTLPAPEYLKLKMGAQIMFVKNDSNHRWVNGTIGTIKDLSMNKISINVKGMSVTVDKESWQQIRYEYNKEEKKIIPVVIGEYKQFPLKLAWAITIHKSQGLTFENVIIDIGNGIFASGQLYVALSRCTSMEGLFFKKMISQNDCIVDRRVLDFVHEKEA